MYFSTVGSPGSLHEGGPSSEHLAEHRGKALYYSHAPWLSSPGGSQCLCFQQYWQSCFSHWKKKINSPSLGLQSLSPQSYFSTQRAKDKGKRFSTWEGLEFGIWRLSLLFSDLNPFLLFSLLEKWRRTETYLAKRFTETYTFFKFFVNSTAWCE